MVTIRDYVQVDQTEDVPRKKIIRANIQVDEESELPDVDEFDGLVLAQGSIAWDISTGAFYGMTSDGQWIKQGEE